MNLWEMVVVIVVIGALAKMYQTRMTVMNERPDDQLRQGDRDADRLRDEVRALKDRIAVLERLATENNRAADLDREIDRLR